MWKQCKGKRTTEENTSTENNTTGGRTSFYNIEEESRTEKRDKIIGAAAGIILLLCVVISGIMVTRKPTINLNNYMTVSIEGYDTVGQASAVFDSENFKKI